MIGVFTIDKNILGRGNTAVIVSIDEDKVAKVFHKHIHKALMEDEFQKSNEVMAAGVRIPKIYGMTNVNGAEAILYEKIKGPSLTQVLKNEPYALLTYLKRMAQIHAGITGRTGVKLPNHLDILASKIKDSPELSIEDTKKILYVLSTLPDGMNLCHGDFHPDNVMMLEGEPAVIDWADASIGHPLGDLARTLLILNYGGLSDSSSIFAYKAQITFRRMMASRYRHYYFKETSFTTKQLHRCSC